MSAYRVSHGRYPNSLAVLVGHFLPVLPANPCAGKPLTYALGTTRCRVLSIGYFATINKYQPPANFMRFGTINYTSFSARSLFLAKGDHKAGKINSPMR